MKRAMDRLSGGLEESNVKMWAPMLIGGALVAYGLSRRSVGGALVAGAGAAFAIQGAHLRDGARSELQFARASVLANCEPSRAYQFWRRLENLPQFMHHLHSVSVIDNRRSRWTAYGPGSSLIDWTAEIVAERDNEIIAWRSVEGSDVQVDGSVEFRTAPGNRGTFVDATIQYRAPAGALGSKVAKMFGKDPAFLMEQNLRRFKALIETGEIPTVEGQAHGPRSMAVGVARLMDVDRPLRRRGQMREMAQAIAEKRRVS
jgi:uncharacterized membrane protein